MRVLHVLCLVAALAACACGSRTIRELHISSITGMQVLRMQTDATDIEVEGEIENQRLFGATVRDLRYTISLGRQFFLAGACPQGLQVPGHARARIRIPVTVRHSKVTTQDYEALFQPGIPYVVRGTASVRDPFRRLLKVEAGGSVARPEQLSVTLISGSMSHVLSIDNIEVQDIRLTSVETIFKMRVHNPFTFPVQFDRIDYRLTSGGQFIGQGAAGKPFSVQPGTQILLFPVSLRTGGVITGLIRAVPEFDVPHLAVSGHATVRRQGRTMRVIFSTVPGERK